MLDLRENYGLLTQAIQECTDRALACGALHPIETTQVMIPDGGVEFMVRSVSNLSRKAREGKTQKTEKPPGFNPFLPPEPELLVAEVSDTHLAILNKFNVIDSHLLLITRDFEDQERLLGYCDFLALWRCLQEFDGLGFYNGGKTAGASQRHKHLQLVPLPLVPGISGTPMDTLWPGSAVPGKLLTLPALPFPHLFTALPDGIGIDIEDAARLCLAAYRDMLKQAGIDGAVTDHGEYQSAPYNLLLARQWMLLTPRSRECWHGISINALGFAGSLFVPDPENIEQIRLAGPMKILSAVTHP